MGSNEINCIKKKLNRKNKKNMSVVISGWPAVGKTTIAENIAKTFNLKLWNGGDILKMMAFEKGYSSSLNHDWWDTDEAQNFMNTRNKDPFFDKEVDNRLIDLINNGNVVVTKCIHFLGFQMAQLTFGYRVLLIIGQKEWLCETILTLMMQKKLF